MDSGRTHEVLTDWRSRLESVAITALIPLLPLLLIGFGLDLHWKSLLASSRVAQAKSLEDQSNRLFPVKSSLERISESLNAFGINFPEGASGLAAARNIADRYRKAYPGVFEFVLFDERNRFEAEGSDLKEFHHLFDTLGGDFAALMENESAPFLARQEKYRPFLGRFFHPHGRRLKRGALSPASFGPRRAFFTCSRLPGRAWFLVWISITPRIEEIGFRLHMDSPGFSKPPGIQNIVDLDRPPETWGEAFGDGSKVFPQALLRMGVNFHRAESVGGYLWAQIPVGPRKRLVFCAPDEAEKDFGASRAIMNRVFLGAWGACFLLGLFLRGRLRVMRLKDRLLMVFGFTTLLPLLLLGLCSQGLLEEHRRILGRNLQNRQEEVLQEFHRRPFDFLTRLECTARVFFSRILPQETQAAIEQAKRGLRRIQEILPADFCCLFDEKARIVFQESSASKGIVESFIKFVRPIVKIQIALENGDRVGPEDEAQEQFFKASLESLVQDTDQFTASFMSSRDSLTRLRAGYNVMALLMHRLKDSNGRTRFVAMHGWGNRTLWEIPRLCQEAFPRGEFDPKVVGFLGVGSFCEALPGMESLGHYLNLVEAQTQVLRQIVSMGSQDWFLTGVSGSPEFPKPALAISPVGFLDGSLRSLRSRLGIFGLFLVGIGFAVGFFISRRLLEPVGLFREGLEAVKERKFRHRVPVLGSDEWGQLTLAFNEMMEGLADLEVGRIVQETFFPKKALTAGGWEVFGNSVTARQMGGDYFDYIPMKGSRILVVLAEVAGTGVAASLVVAMLKATVGHPTRPENPGGIMENLDDCLSRTAGRYRMSCFVGVFDPAERRFAFSRMGENHTFVVGVKNARQLKGEAPAGATKDSERFPEDSIVLGAGESIFLFSRAVMKTRASEPRERSLEELSETLAGLGRETAEGTEKAVREWKSRLVSGSGTKSRDGLGSPSQNEGTILILQESPGPRP